MSRILFPISSMQSFYMHYPKNRIAFIIPVVLHWLERKIAQWAHYEGSIRWPIAIWVDHLPWSYISLLRYIRDRESQDYTHWLDDEDQS